MRQVSDEKLDKFIASVQGTAGIYDQGAADEAGFDLDDLDVEDWQYIENDVFSCTRCGWWCDSSEMNGVHDLFCDDCAEEDEIDE